MPRISITREYMYGTNAEKYEAVSSNFEEEHIAVIACPACRNAIFVNQDHTITIGKNTISVTPDIHCRRCNKNINIDKGILTMIDAEPPREKATGPQNEATTPLQKKMEEQQKKPKEKPKTKEKPANKA